MDRLSRIDMLHELLSKEPDDVFLNYALGLEYVSELNHADAEIQFSKALQLDPEYLGAYYQLGKLYESQLKNKEALSYYQQGLAKATAQRNNKAVNEFNEAIFMLYE